MGFQQKITLEAEIRTSLFFESYRFNKIKNFKRRLLFKNLF
jgi:hypothetical protein